MIVEYDHTTQTMLLIRLRLWLVIDFRYQISVKESKVNYWK